MDNEDNPFADPGDTADDFNPFSDGMFDGSAKSEPPKSTPAPTPTPASVPKTKTKAPVAAAAAIPDWADAGGDEFVSQELDSAPAPAPKSSQSKKQFVAKNEMSTLLSANPNEEVPAWASEAPPPKKVPEKQQAVRGGTFGNAAPATEPLLSSAEPTEPEIDPHRTKNWPPFPKKCCWPFHPCFHHNFKAELPGWGYSSVKFLLAIWYCTAFALFWNFISTLAALDCSGCTLNTQLESAGIALLFLLCCIPCSYYCWFDTIHNAVRTDSSLKFGCFFFMFSIQICVTIVMAIGFPGSGAAGIWSAAQVTDDGNFEVSIMMFSAGILWIVLAIAQIVAVQNTLRVFRNSGMSIAQARAEAQAAGGRMAVQAAKTEAGQEAIRTAAVSAVSNA